MQTRTENQLANLVVDIAFDIHRAYGPGLFESIYDQLLCYELEQNGIAFVRQKPLNLVHDGVDMGLAFKLDVLVEDKLIIELKSVNELGSVHKKQLLTYLKITGLKLGLLINFNQALLKEGIRRVVNGLEEEDRV